jgi:hypothetical protein
MLPLEAAASARPEQIEPSSVEYAPVRSILTASSDAHAAAADRRPGRLCRAPEGDRRLAFCDAVSACRARAVRRRDTGCGGRAVQGTRLGRSSLPANGGCAAGVLTAPGRRARWLCADVIDDAVIQHLAPGPSAVVRPRPSRIPSTSAEWQHMLSRSPIKHTFGSHILPVPHDPQRGSPSLNPQRRELPSA